MSIIKTNSVEVLETKAEIIMPADIADKIRKNEDMPLTTAATETFKAGLLPGWVKTVEQAVIVAYAAKELGFQPLAGFRAFYIVNNQVALTSMGMGAVLRQKGAIYYVTKDREKIDEDNFITEIKFFRPGDRINGQDVVHTIDFRWKEAALAGLIDKDTWKKYPRAMMYARCLSKAARLVCPDWILGLYMADEIDNNLGYNDEGELIK